MLNKKQIEHLEHGVHNLLYELSRVIEKKHTKVNLVPRVVEEKVVDYEESRKEFDKIRTEILSAMDKVIFGGIGVDALTLLQQVNKRIEQIKKLGV